MPQLPVKILTFFRQYTTNRLNTAEGRIFPRYWIYLGVGFPAGKNKKGRNRVRTVPRITIPIVTSCCENVIAFSSFSGISISSTYLSFLSFLILLTLSILPILLILPTYLSLHVFLKRFAQECQYSKDRDHRRDDKIVCAEQDQTGERYPKPDQRALMSLFF